MESQPPVPRITPSTAKVAEPPASPTGAAARQHPVQVHACFVRLPRVATVPRDNVESTAAATA